MGSTQSIGSNGNVKRMIHVMKSSGNAATGDLAGVAASIGESRAGFDSLKLGD
jgi:hypothetical protein